MGDAVVKNYNTMPRLIIAPGDSTQEKTAVQDPDDIAKARALFTKLFSRYKQTDEDPVQISRYLPAYLDKNYKLVTGSKSTYYSTKSSADDSLYLEQYMEFYRGLS
jgi:hypothetical protein